MLIVLDANIVMRNPLLTGGKWDAAQRAIAAGRLRVVLPDIARLEAIGGYRRQRIAASAEIRKAMRRSTAVAKDAAKAVHLVYQQESEAYPSLLAARLSEIGVEVAESPSIDHIDLVERAIARKPPFNDRGEGFRDTLVWLTALEQVEDHPFSDLTLITEDKDFRSKQRALSDEALSECGAMLMIFAQFDEANIPDEYDDGEFDLQDAGVSERALGLTVVASLPGLDLTYRTPGPIDFATVRTVNSLEYVEGSLDVRKRYGQDVYELTADFTANIEAEIMIVNDPDDDPPYNLMSANWIIGVRWAGVAFDELEETELQLLSLDEVRPELQAGNSAPD